VLEGGETITFAKNRDGDKNSVNYMRKSSTPFPQLINGRSLKKRNTAHAQKTIALQRQCTREAFLTREIALNYFELQARYKICPLNHDENRIWHGLWQ